MPYEIRPLWDHTHEWIRQWLTTRKQRVVLDGEASSEVHVDSVVPQGTVLGPLMFLLYANDISEGVNSEVKLFADDCLLFFFIEPLNLKATPNSYRKILAK